LLVLRELSTTRPPARRFASTIRVFAAAGIGKDANARAGWPFSSQFSSAAMRVRGWVWGDEKFRNDDVDIAEATLRKGIQITVTLLARAKRDDTTVGTVLMRLKRADRASKRQAGYIGRNLIQVDEDQDRRAVFQPGGNLRGGFLAQA
jgi:hypothetical protein